jgi:phosphorylcholine metabolism protein LicD
MLFTKKRRTPISGDIEMLEIRSSKKLGRKRSSMRKASSIRSVSRKRKRSSSSSTNYKKTKKINLRKLYRQRVKKSICRKKSRPDCDNNKSCKYTKGSIRKYCRKAHNQRI